MLSDLLSNKDNKLLNEWIKNRQKPLFIMGYDGCGKSYQALELLKDYHTICVGGDFIKQGKDMNEFLDSCLKKKDIFMMISQEKQYKALLIDDLQLFSQYDKPTLSKIYKYIQNLDCSNYPIVFVCNYTEDKCIKMIKQNSVIIEIKYNYTYYKHIFVQKSLSVSNLNKLLKQTKNLNTLLSLGNSFKDLKNDRIDPLDITLKDIIDNDYSVNDLLRKCSSEYSVLSLNIIENIPNMVNNCKPSTLFDTYKQICIDDFIEYKYISYNICLYLRVFYSCVLPLTYLKQLPLTLTKVKYNTYISRSIIQIHNQTILKGETVIYLSILKDIYNYISNYNTDVSIDKINTKLRSQMIDLKTLEKQIKVFNYYYNKEFTKKQFSKVCKQLTF